MAEADTPELPFFDVVLADTQPSRFKEIEDGERSRILSGLHSDNTKLATKRAVKTFREWLTTTGRAEKPENADFDSWGKTKLNSNLQCFWLEARTKENEQYKSTSLINIRHGLNRFIQESRDDIDIIKDKEFRESNRHFKAMLKVRAKAKQSYMCVSSLSIVYLN